MLLASIIKKVAPPPTVESFNRFLFFGPHPDDIEIGAGATIAKLAGKGKKITFVICTDGRYGLDFAPDPCVDSECHTDHLNVGEASRRIAFFAPFGQIMEGFGAEGARVEALAYYMTARPNQYIGTGNGIEKQFKSIQTHQSQFPKNSDAFKQVALYLTKSSKNSPASTGGG